MDNTNMKTTRVRSRKRQTNQSTLTKNQRLILTGLFVLCMAAIVISVFMIVSNSYQDKKNGERIVSDINVFNNPDVATDGSGGDPYAGVTFPAGMLPNFKPFYARCKDIVGWVEIDGLENFAYPVVQTDNNSDYMRKNLDGKYSKEGTAFMDYRCNTKDITNQNLIIYGHNNKNGLMFASLLEYNVFKNEKNGLNAYKKSPLLTYYSLYEKMEYKICAVFIANVEESDGPVFNYLETDLSDKAKFEQFAKDLKLRSIIDIPVDIKYGDSLITLSTCTYEFKNARFVVVARKLRKGEGTDVNVDAAKLNSSAVMPDSYVNTYNVGRKLKDVA